MISYLRSTRTTELYLALTEYMNHTACTTGVTYGTPGLLLCIQYVQVYTYKYRTAVSVVNVTENREGNKEDKKNPLCRVQGIYNSSTTAVYDAPAHDTIPGTECWCEIHTGRAVRKKSDTIQIYTQQRAHAAKQTSA